MFGMGFTEILFIAVIAILFLGPDKLPSAMVEVAKFFRNAKRTIGSVKESIEDEMNVKEIKEEALAYKKELLSATDEIKEATEIPSIGTTFADLNDDFMDDEDEVVKPKAEKVTFEKKPKKSKKPKKEDVDV